MRTPWIKEIFTYKKLSIIIEAKSTSGLIAIIPFIIYFPPGSDSSLPDRRYIDLTFGWLIFGITFRYFKD